MSITDLFCFVREPEGKGIMGIMSGNSHWDAELWKLLFGQIFLNGSWLQSIAKQKKNSIQTKPK